MQCALDKVVLVSQIMVCGMTESTYERGKHAAWNHLRATGRRRLQQKWCSLGMRPARLREEDGWRTPMSKREGRGSAMRRPRSKRRAVYGREGEESR